MSATATPRAQRKENTASPHTARQVASIAATSATSTVRNVAGIAVRYCIELADGATATTSYVVDQKIEITDVLVQKRGGAGGAADTILLTDSSDSPITDAIDINKANKVLTRSATIDSAKSTVAAGGSFKVVKTKASAANVACLVEVIGVLRA